MKEITGRQSKHLIPELIGLILSLTVLSPFILVVFNAAKKSADIVISPIAPPSDWGQLFVNLKNVIGNQNFSYWKSFGSSLYITTVSLVLLTLFPAWRHGCWFGTRQNGPS